MMPETVTATIISLKMQKEAADINKGLAIGSDKRYYAVMSDAYSLAIALMLRNRERAS